MKLIKSQIDSLDLSHLVDKITRIDHKSLVTSKAGNQHYKLLAYISLSKDNMKIVELGTHHGTSSLCLCINEKNSVTTFDIKNYYSIKQSPTNLKRIIGDIFQLPDELYGILDSDVIFVDTAHDGVFESNIYNFLVENNFKGILLLDDIHFNKEMELFWEKIDITKYDISDLGHGNDPRTTGKCGTGLVDFSNIVEIIYE